MDASLPLHLLLSGMVLAIVSPIPVLADNTWTSLGPDGGGIFSLAVDPTNPGVLCAGTLGGGVFRSSDAGASWKPANVGLGPGTVTALAIDPQNTSTVYALIPGVVSTSTDGAQHWNAVTAAPPISGYYLQALGVDPQNSGTVYAAACNVFLRSADGGATWTISSFGSLLSPTCPTVVAADPLNAKGVYIGSNSARG